MRGDKEPVPVLYILGAGRSGSTVLERTLGQMDDFFAAGELVWLWEKGLRRNGLCGCGAPVRSCPVWTRILAAAFPGWDPPFETRMARTQDRFVRTRHLPALLVPAVRRLWLSKLRDHARRLGRLYRAIRTVTGRRIIVDSSKQLPYGFLLETVPGIRVSFVHLVRDPRAVAFSWKRIRPQKGGSPLPRYSTLYSISRYLLENVSAEILRRESRRPSIFLRYEDWAARPADGLRKILKLLDFPSGRLPIRNGHIVDMKPTHSVAGNPQRFRTGRIALRPDMEWTRGIRPSDRAWIEHLTRPLMNRYGYAAGSPTGLREPSA